MTSTTLTEIPFHSQSIPAYQNEDREAYVALKPICTNIGIQYEAQYHRLQRDEWATMSIMNIVGADGKNPDITPAFGNTDPISYNFRSANMHTLTDEHIPVHMKGRCRDTRNPSKAPAGHMGNEGELNNKSLSSPGQHRDRLDNKSNWHQCSSGVSSTSIVQSSAAAIASKSEVVKSVMPRILRKKVVFDIPAFLYSSVVVTPQARCRSAIAAASFPCVFMVLMVHGFISETRRYFDKRVHF